MVDGVLIKDIDSCAQWFLSPHGVASRLHYEWGGGGTPIHYLYGYVPPKGVVILKLLI